MGNMMPEALNSKNDITTGIRTLGTLTIALALILCVTASWANEKGYKNDRHNPTTKLENLTKKLSLTKEQQDKILPILEAKHEKMKNLHEQMKEIRQNTIAQIEAELTPEQQEKFKKSREERRKKMKAYKGKHGKGHKQGSHDKEKNDD